MIAAALVRNDEVRAAFDAICWVSVGQEPDTLALQQALHRQLLTQPLPKDATTDDKVQRSDLDPRRRQCYRCSLSRAPLRFSLFQLALGVLKGAAREMAVLLILDDIWTASHATPLNFVDGSDKRSAVVVTTRIRSLLDGAAEVQCGVLSLEASLELLLRTGGCEQLLDAPPPAALEAVELCGRLPLALGIAGGIIDELADVWQDELCALLKEEFSEGEASVEERVVTASLRAVPEKMRAEVEALFVIFAIFPEDAVVPAATLDAVAPLMQSGSASSSAAQQKRQVRKCLQQLLKANMLRGSIELGVSAHDLVRDCMIRRAEAREGGMLALQRQALPLLVDAFDAIDHAAGPLTSYVCSSLHWHVRQCQQPEVAVHADAVITRALVHKSGDVRKQGAIGIGVEKIQAAADAADVSGDHFEAAKLTWSLVAVKSLAGGVELKRTWASLKLLEAAGRGSAESRQMESHVIHALSHASDGFAIGTPEHEAMLERMKELSALTQGEQADGTAGTATKSKEAMDAEFGLGLPPVFAAYALNGLAAYPGPMTHEMLVQVHNYLMEASDHMAKAAAKAPDAAMEQGMWHLHNLFKLQFPRHHVLPEFVLDEKLGEGGMRMKEIIEHYSVETVHPVVKHIAVNADCFAYGMEPLGMLQFYGNVKEAKKGIAKCLAVHKYILNVVRQGLAKGEEYAFEILVAATIVPTMLLAANDLETLKDFLENSLSGVALEDKAVTASLMPFFTTAAFCQWKTDDGHLFGTIDSWLLIVRALTALVEEDTEENRAKLREWLPPPAELLRIGEYEVFWRATACGANHQALICARLHGERLGDWSAAAEVAEGMLMIEPFQPAIRTEALRLLGRARHALGAQAAACGAAEGAVVEAVKAKYAWFEMMALADLLKWCEAGEAEGVRERLRGVAARLAATPEELVEVLGEGVL